MADPDVHPNYNASCRLCGRKFSHRKGLYAHTRKFHPDQKVEFVRKQRIVCCLCGEECVSMTALHRHLGGQHEDVLLQFERRTFYSEDEFREWKARTEEETGSRFAVCRSESELVDGRTVTHFKCSRSALYYRRPEKLGKSCPAYLSAYKTKVDEAVEIEVIFQSVHLGHPMDFGRPQRKKKKKSVRAKNQESTGASNPQPADPLSYACIEIIPGVCDALAEGGGGQSAIATEDTRLSLEEAKAELRRQFDEALEKCRSADDIDILRDLVRTGSARLTAKYAPSRQPPGQSTTPRVRVICFDVKH